MSEIDKNETTNSMPSVGSASIEDLLKDPFGEPANMTVLEVEKEDIKIQRKTDISV